MRDSATCLSFAWRVTSCHPRSRAVSQYASMHLKTQLNMVLGHESCGTVQAVITAKFQGAQEPSRIQLLLQNLLPGLHGVDPQLPLPQRLAFAIEANVH